MGSTIPSKYLPIYIKLILYLLHFYLTTCLVASGALLGSFAIIYCFYLTIFYTKELRLGQPIQKYLTSPNLRKRSKNVQHIFRSFQVLHANTNALFGPYYLVFNALFMLCGIYINFVLIRYWTALQPHAKIPLSIGLVLSLSAWTNLLELGRFLYFRGNKVFKSWKNYKWDDGMDNKVMAKFGASCKPILFAYGTQFVIKNGSLFNFYRGVIRGTCRVLLTTK